MPTRTQKQPARRKYHCPVEAALDVIGGKWKIVILCWLKQGMHRFGELRRRIPGVSERMLTQHLRELERDGIVSRKVYPEVPPRVEYSLTAFGETLGPVMATLNEWGQTHLERIEER
jgi:DNA-binding HxlR family transcriptional regulator